MSDRTVSDRVELASVPSRPLKSAVVLGGSLAGMLAARALVEFADVVTIVERDVLPDGPERRKNLPQAQHVHLLWSGGVQAIEELVPGTVDLLGKAGAHRLSLTTDMVALSSQGWFRRWNESHYMILSSRDLLDATVRARVLDDDRIKLVERAEALGLAGTATAVTGVRVRGHDAAERTLPADLVVDTTGRASAPRSGCGSSASRAPRSVRSTPVSRTPVGSTARPRRPGTASRSSTSRPPRGREARQGGRPAARRGRPLAGHPVGHPWGEPSPDETDFLRFALEELRHPVIGDFIAHAEPLTGVVFTRSTANRRYYYERARHWPDGFAVLGDALAAYNPTYGHGMSVAAQSAVALRDAIRARGWGTPGLARAAQKAAARPVNAAWDLATGQDVFYPGATASGPTLRDRILAAYVDRLLYTATGNGRIARRFTDVSSSAAPTSSSVPASCWPPYAAL